MEALRRLALAMECPPRGESPQAEDRRLAWSRPDTIKAWAKVFGIHRNTMRQRLEEGKDPRSRKMGRHWRVALDDLPAKERAKHLPATDHQD
jgi:hypothetical protein